MKRIHVLPLLASIAVAGCGGKSKPSTGGGGGSGTQQRQGKSGAEQAFHGLRSFPLRASAKRGWTSIGVVGMDYGAPALNPI